MPTPWEIVTTPALLAEVRAWALTSVPPYPASAAQLRAAGAEVEPVAPAGWVVTPYPEGVRFATVSCVVDFRWFDFLSDGVRVYGMALLLGDDQLALDYYPPGYTLGPSNAKLNWPVKLLVADGGPNA